MADSKPVIPLQLDNQDVLLKRVSGNFEKHGDDPVPVLDIAWEAIVPPAVMVGLLGECCDRVLFNTKGDLVEPSEVFKRSDMPVPIAEDLVAQFVRFVLSDNIEREFGEEPDEGDEAKPSQVCPITKLAYEPKVGGGVWLGGSVRIRPGDASEYWAFLEHQGRHAKLTIADSAIKVGNGKQQQLPLTQPTQPGEGFAAGAAARASAPSPDSAPAKQPVADEAATPVTAGEGEGGDTTAAPPSASQEPAPVVDRSPEELAKFEASAKAQAEAFTRGRRGRNVIDGRGNGKGAH